MALEILYESESMVAVNKPHGLLVHRSNMAKDAKEFALQQVRDQVGQKVFLAHRLDRKTSGVLLLSKDKETDSSLQKLFMERKMEKEYIAIVRGFLEGKGFIDYELENNHGKVQSAVTHYECLETFEIPLPTRRHPTSRYSLIRLKPTTGRFHQIRKHLAHIFHPILGDRPHGCNKQNKLWKETYNMNTMMLHAASLSFILDQKSYHIKAKCSQEFLDTLKILRSQNLIPIQNAK